MKRAKKPVPRGATDPAAGLGPGKVPALADADVRRVYKAMGGSALHEFNVLHVQRVLGLVWTPEDDTKARDRAIGATMRALAAFKPADEIEAMIAGQAVALNIASMEALRRAQHPEQTSEVASKLRRDGANLARGFVDMLDALDRRRGTAPRQQVVRVERVVVQEGGRAIVGNVDAGAAAAGATAAPAPPAVGHDALGPVLDLPPCAIPGLDAVAAGPAPGGAAASRAGEGEG